MAAAALRAEKMEVERQKSIEAENELAQMRLKVQEETQSKLVYECTAFSICVHNFSTCVHNFHMCTQLQDMCQPLFLNIHSLMTVTPVSQASIREAESKLIAEREEQMQATIIAMQAIIFYLFIIT